MDYTSNRIQNIKPYTAGEQVEYRIKLNTNENPYPPTPRIDTLLKSIDIDKLKLYPDPNSTSLTQAIAKRYSISDEMVFVGNGSDEILAFVNMAFFDSEDEVMAYPDITYSFYPVYNELFDIKSMNIPLTEDMRINLEEYSGLDVKGYFIANPNAPTGIALTSQQIEEFIKNNSNKLIVVDEAYIEFCDESVVNLTKNYDNLLVIKTMSKAYSLAGIRCGYAIGNNKLIKSLNRVKDCFNSYPVDYITQLVAQEAIEDVEYYETINKNIVATRARATESLQDMGFKVLPSSSNFLFVTHSNLSACDIYTKLKEKKILVRYWDKLRIDNYIRISIGTDKDMDTFLDVLSQIL